MGDAAPPLPRLLAAADDDFSSGMARAYAALCALTTGLIVLGAMVRAHGAGLACPDWPLCFGEVVPRMNLEVAFEWTHRLVAGAVSLSFAGLGALALRRPALRRRVLAPLAAAAALLATQVLLGALTVWHLLAAWTVTAHLLVGNAFNACLLLTALQLGGNTHGELARIPAAARAAVAAAAALLFVQLVLGGLLSSTYAGMACPEWPQCNGGAFFPSLRGAVGLHLAHRWNGVLVLLALGGAAAAARGVPRLGGLTALALALGVVQLGAGVANVLLAIPVEVTGLHSLLAALLVLAITASLHASLPPRTSV
jgi:cytochrome c oxidase assembly protein subunit 15